MSTAAGALASSRRIVVKVGSALLVDPEGGVATGWLAGLCAELAAHAGAGRRPVIVSSGAIALGARHLGGRPERLADKQAAAAVGQSLLMAAWNAALAPHGLVAGQMLLSPDDTERRRRWLNARATMDALLDAGIVPVVNENDTVATEEIRYGDNDRLAARAAQLARADLLVLLSDVDGLYSADPRSHPAAVHIPHVEALTPDIVAMASGPNRAAGVGTGGMATKLAAAAIARSAGCATLIADGRVHRPLEQVAGGARATLVAAPTSPIAAYKQWIAGSLRTEGAIRIDAGAAAALKQGRSLLPAGVTAVEGGFGKGDCVRILAPDGGRLGVGLSLYAAAEVERMKGRRSEAAEAVLGYRGPVAVVHRDDMVVDG